MLCTTTSAGHEVVQARHGEVVHLLVALVGDLDDVVPAARRCGRSGRGAAPAPRAARRSAATGQLELAGSTAATSARLTTGTGLADAPRRLARERSRRRGAAAGAGRRGRGASERAANASWARWHGRRPRFSARRRSRNGTSCSRGRRNTAGGTCSSSSSTSQRPWRRSSVQRVDVDGAARAARPRPCAAAVVVRRPPSPRRWASTASSLLGQPARAEPGQPPRHRDALAGRSSASGRQPSVGEERMAERGAHHPAEAGADPVDRLACRRRRRPTAWPPRRRPSRGSSETTCTHSPLVPRRCSSAAVTSSPVAGSSSSVSQATHLPIDGRAPMTFRVEGWSPLSSSSRST